MNTLHTLLCILAGFAALLLILLVRSILREWAGLGETDDGLE